MGSPSPQDIFAGYPEWLRVAIIAVVAAVVLWILARILKWALSFLAVLVLVGGVAFAAWLLFH